MEEDPAVVARLRAAGCVFAEEEARLLTEAARTPADLEAMVGQREKGLPLEQVIGWAEFCGLRIFVDPGVFVPRRRSEFLVETAVSLAARSEPGDRRPVLRHRRARPRRRLGLAAARRTAAPGVPAGCGSPPGCTPPTSIRPLSGARAATSSRGRARLRRRPVRPAACGAPRPRHDPDLQRPLRPHEDIGLLPPEARDYEPRTALDGGSDGLAVLRRVAAAAPRWLAPGGVLLVETSDLQAALMAGEMDDAGLAGRIHADAGCDSTVVTGTGSRDGG